MLWIVLIMAITSLLLFAVSKSSVKRSIKIYHVPEKWRTLLNNKVHFYSNLDDLQKRQFESDVQRFLRDVKISGVKTDVELEDRLLIASSAVIPLFGFPAWTYSHLDEVLCIQNLSIAILI